MYIAEVENLLGTYLASDYGEVDGEVNVMIDFLLLESDQRLVASKVHRDQDTKSNLKLS